jgi:hypothetical protein
MVPISGKHARHVPPVHESDLAAQHKNSQTTAKQHRTTLLTTGVYMSYSWRLILWCICGTAVCTRVFAFKHAQCEASASTAGMHRQSKHGVLADDRRSRAVSFQPARACAGCTDRGLHHRGLATELFCSCPTPSSIRYTMSDKPAAAPMRIDKIGHAVRLPCPCHWPVAWCELKA